MLRLYLLCIVGANLVRTSFEIERKGRARNAQNSLISDEPSQPSILGSKGFDILLECGDAVSEFLSSLFECLLTLLLLDSETS
jgi:hypothetical protein